MSAAYHSTRAPAPIRIHSSTPAHPLDAGSDAPADAKRAAAYKCFTFPANVATEYLSNCTRLKHLMFNGRSTESPTGAPLFHWYSELLVNSGLDAAAALSTGVARLSSALRSAAGAAGAAGSLTTKTEVLSKSRRSTQVGKCGRARRTGSHRRLQYGNDLTRVEGTPEVIHERVKI